MEIKLQKKIFTDESYRKVSKSGNEYQTSFYCIVLDSGYSFIFTPSNDRDYAVLDALAEKVFINTPKKK